MPACEKCWADAHLKALNNPNKFQSEYYQNLLTERDNNHNPCSLKEQAGSYWDEEKQCDIRKDKFSEYNAS